MRMLALALALVTLPLFPARAQLRIQVGLPAVLPPLIVVQPGVQVVRDYDEEVFFTGGYYWVRRDNRWYRARDYRTQQWRFVEQRRVPVVIYRAEPGRYRHWNGEQRHEERRDQRQQQMERRDDRHDARNQERGRGHEGKEQRKEQRREEHERR
jgi:hypothetical protein